MPPVSNRLPDMDADRFLATTISTLASSTDLLPTIKNLACLAVPGLADWCSVFMFEGEQTIRRLANAPSRDMETLYSFDLHAPTGPGHVLRTGERQLLTNITDEAVAALGLKPDE